MKRLIPAFLALIMMFSLCACGSGAPASTAPAQPAETSSPAEEVAAPAASVEETVVYAEDEVVNQFITAYNLITESEFSSITKGNIRTKYYAYSYGYYCELLNSNTNNKITVTINETNDNADKGVSGMRDVFHDVAVTIDPSLSDEEVNAHFDELVSNKYMKEGDTLGSMVILFVPDIEGRSRGHIKISAQ